MNETVRNSLVDCRRQRLWDWEMEPRSDCAAVCMCCVMMRQSTQLTAT